MSRVDDAASAAGKDQPAFLKGARNYDGYRARQLRLERRAHIEHMGAVGMPQMPGLDPSESAQLGVTHCYPPGFPLAWNGAEDLSFGGGPLRNAG